MALAALGPWRGLLSLLVLASLAYPVYYFGLSFVVHLRTPPGRPEGLQPRID